MEAYLFLVMHKNLQFGGAFILGVQPTMNFNVPQKENNMLDKLTPNKKNIPPELESQPQQKSSMVTRQLISLRNNWKTKDLEEAMDVIERRFTSLKKVGQYCNIPLTNLSDHLTNKTTLKKCGTPGVLLADEEVVVVEWVFGI
jgi:hypothetical protein